MSFGSAGYTPTFSGDLSASLAEGAARRTKKALDKLRKALRRKRISKKLEERRKARTPEQKKEVEKIAVLEEKEDLQEEKEVQKELVQEEKKEVTAQQKLLPASRSSAIVSNRVVPVTVREEQRKSITPAQKLLPAAGSRQAISGSTGPVGGGLSTVVVTDQSGRQTTSVIPAEKTEVIRSAARKGGGISSESFFNQAQTGVGTSGEYLTKEQRKAAFLKSREASSQLVKRNNDAIISAIKGEVANVRSAVVEVASETTESKNVMSTLVQQEKDQTNVFKKQAQVLDDALQFKKRSLRKQEIFLKQQEGKKKKDMTGAAALVGGGAALGAGFGGGGGGGGLGNLGLLAPLGAAAGLFRRGLDTFKGLRQKGSSLGQRLSGAFRRGRNFLGRQFGRGRDFLGRQFGRGANYWNRFTNLMQRRMFGLNQYTSPIGPMPLDSGPKGLGGWAKAGAGEVGDVFGNVPRLQSAVQTGTPRKPTRKPPGPPPALSKLKAKAGGVLDKIFDLVPGLKGLREKLKGLTLKKAVKFLNSKVLGTINGIKKGGGFVAKGALKLASPFINPFVKGLGVLTKFVSGPAKFLSGVFKPIFGAGKALARVLGPILEIGTFALDTKSRLDSGYSPARAILPLIPRTLLTMGGAALGGTIGAAGGPLSILGAMGGGFLGSLLGDQVVKFIDGSWNNSWDNSIFKDFNEGSYQLLSEKLGYEPPRSETEANDRRIEQEAAAKGLDPRQYQGYSGAYDDASMQAPEAPSQGGFASRLLDAASRHIYSPFGMRNGRQHKGLDISGGPYKLGAALASKMGGRVAMAEDLGNSGWGKYVVLNHANGTSSLYGHLSKYFVKRGDNVDPGQIIGNVGSTGSSEGPHLHFELGSGWNGGVITGHVDPKNYIDQYVGAATGAGTDAVSFNAPSGTQSQTIASSLNTDMYSGGAQQTIAVQLPPSIYPVQDGNVQQNTGPSLERVNNELLYLQNVEAKVLVG